MQKSGISLRFVRDEVKCYDGTPLPPELRARLLRECERLGLAEQQFAALEKTRHENLPGAARKRIEDLSKPKGVGPVGASRLALELYWRTFHNRREVGACVGLVPQPYDSGESRWIRASANRATGACVRCLPSWRGHGCATNPIVRWHSGSSSALRQRNAIAAPDALRSLPSRDVSRLHSGAI